MLWLHTMFRPAKISAPETQPGQSILADRYRDERKARRWWLGTHAGALCELVSGAAGAGLTYDATLHGNSPGELLVGLGLSAASMIGGVTVHSAYRYAHQVQQSVEIPTPTIPVAILAETGSPKPPQDPVFDPISL